MPWPHHTASNAVPDVLEDMLDVMVGHTIDATMHQTEVANLA